MESGFFTRVLLEFKRKPVSLPYWIQIASFSRMLCDKRLESACLKRYLSLYNEYSYRRYAL